MAPGGELQGGSFILQEEYSLEFFSFVKLFFSETHFYSQTYLHFNLLTKMSSVWKMFKLSSNGKLLFILPTSYNVHNRTKCYCFKQFETRPSRTTTFHNKLMAPLFWDWTYSRQSNVSDFNTFHTILYHKKAWIFSYNPWKILHRWVTIKPRLHNVPFSYHKMVVFV